MSPRRLSLFVASVAVTSIAWSASARANGVFVNIGVLGDGAFSDAFGVNAGGQVVGSSRTGSLSIYSHAVLFTASLAGTPTLEALGTLGGSSSASAAINSSSTIVGGAQIAGDVAYRAFYQQSGSAMRSLGTLGGSNSSAAAINVSGQVVGEAETNSFGYRAFRTSAGGGAMANLGTFGGDYSSAKAINDSGQVAGGAAYAPDGANPAVTRAFRYTGTPGLGGAMVDLGTLGGPNSFAYGINNAGGVVGEADVSYDVNTGDRVTRAFRYTGTPGSGGAMISLGTLGGPNSVATAINNFGQIVGKSDINNNADTAPFAYVNGAMVNLDTWLDTANPSAGLNTVLLDANQISDTGYIVGTAAITTPQGTRRYGYRLDAISLLSLPGDANRDRRVNFDDLLVLAANYNRPAGATWSEGDFTLDGAVNFNDLLQLAANYNQTQSGTLEGDWVLARAAVPEPAALCTLAAAGTALRRRRR
jgi:probable HAF family extracellular repeat protein